MVEAMLHSDYPLQALAVQRGAASVSGGGGCRITIRSQHLGGVLYLFVRGMCGLETPIVDGHPAGVFSWEPPAALVIAMSEPAGSRSLVMSGRLRRILEPADVHVAQRLERTGLRRCHADRSVVELAVGLVVRALRGGSVWVDLRSVAEQTQLPELPWPLVDEWLTAVAASPPLGTPSVLRLFGDLLYLDRYWLEEQQVCDDVLALVVPSRVARHPTWRDCSRRASRSSGPRPKVALSQG